MNLQTCLEAVGALGFAVWAGWTEIRFRNISAQNQELRYALSQAKNKEAVKSESDTDAINELKAHLSSGS
jgi:hypothetical protein